MKHVGTYISMYCRYRYCKEYETCSYICTDTVQNIRHVTHIWTEYETCTYICTGTVQNMKLVHTVHMNMYCTEYETCTYICTGTVLNMKHVHTCVQALYRIWDMYIHTYVCTGTVQIINMYIHMVNLHLQIVYKAYSIFYEKTYLFNLWFWRFSNTNLVAMLNIFTYYATQISSKVKRSLFILCK